MIIAIDGPSGAGKSSVAKRLAQTLNFNLLDTGAIYRCVALIASQQNINDKSQLAEIAKNLDITFKQKNNKQHVILNGADVTEQIRTLEISRRVNEISPIPEIRLNLLQKQRDLAQSHDTVVEGRDTTTVVFPNADIKIFFTASVEARALRRQRELEAKNEIHSLDEIIEHIKNRDETEFNRKASPLLKADDAILLDTSELDFQQSLDALLNIVTNHPAYKKKHPSELTHKKHTTKAKNDKNWLENFLTPNIPKKLLDDKILALLESSNPQQAVQELPDIEFFEIVNTLGYDQVPELLELASPQQFQTCIDFTAWKNEQFSIKKLTPSINALAQLSNEQFQHLFKKIDPELIPLYIRLNLQLYFPENPNDEPQLPELPNHSWRQSPCMTFWIAFPDTDEYETLELLINKLYEALPIEEVIPFLQNTQWELNSDLESTLLHFRTQRLYDFGFKPGIDAINVFSPLKPENERKKILDNLSNTIIPPAHLPLQTPFALALQNTDPDQAPSFIKIFASLNQEQHDAITSQLASLSNDVAVADHIEPDQWNEIASSIAFTIYMLSLGLEYIANNDPELYIPILNATPLQNIFRIAFSLTLELKAKARLIVERKQLTILDNDPISLLNPMQQDTIHGLLEPIPRPAFSSMAPFTSLLDFQNVSKTLADILFYELLAFALLKIQKDDIARIAFNYDLTDSVESLNFDKITLNFLVRKFLNDADKLQPFSTSELPSKNILLNAISTSNTNDIIKDTKAPSTKILFTRLIDKLKTDLTPLPENPSIDALQTLLPICID